MVAPSSKGTEPDAVPEVIVTPFTFIVAVLSAVVGVTVADDTALGTVVVYVVVVPVVPVLVSAEAGVSAMVLNKALLDCARVTVIE